MARWVLLMIFFVGQISYALQIKNVKPNETINAFVSSKGKTRIFVKGSRIARLNGTPSAYIYKNDNVKGEVFIMPVGAYRRKPFSLFVTDEKGATYQLKLIPKSTLAETIMLKPMGDNKEATHFEQSSPYEMTLIKLIRYMVNGISPEGYEVVKPKKADLKSIPLGNIATITLLATYSGAKLKGEVHRLQNIKNIPITIDEKELYRPATRAIAIESHTIPANKSTLVYGVLSNG